MKKFLILLLSVATMPVYAQGILSSLNSYQESLEPKHVSRPGDSGGSSTTVGSSGKPVPEVKPGGGASSTTNNKCEENDQTSLPLSYITSLIMEKDGKLDIVHDPRQGTLSVKSPDMISNCSSMLEWKLKQPELQGKKAYAIEVKFNGNGECTDQGCKYKVAKVKNGEFEKYEEMVFKPTLKGFEECLQKSGVIVNGKVDPKAIYSSQANEKFSGIEQTGKLYVLSHGPSSAMVKAKYGKFEAVDRCDYYEQAHPQIKTLLTLADEEKERLDAEAAKLQDCPINEYYKVADFLEKYEDYNSQLSKVRDRLILESAKKSAEAILKGKYTEDDLKVMSDFDRYIVQPKIEKAIALYQEMLNLEGDAKKAKQEEMKVLLSEITALKQKPYFTGAQTKKLIDDGRFEEAEKLNTIMLNLDNYTRLGAKQENVVITPQVAASRVTSAKQAFKQQLEVERENYEIRTGQSTGKADYYTQLAKRMRQNIQIRTQNFGAEIQSEYERVQQPNGYCFKYWRNTQKCIQDTVERVQELTALLQHYNKVDEERAAEYDAKAKQYGELEAQGRRYIATQNGEAVEEPTPKKEEPVDTTRPAPRAQEAQQGQNGVYTFNWQQQAQAQAQMTPQNYQYPQNPYAQQNMFQQQNPYQYYSQPLGAQGYGGVGYQMQGGYNFQYGAGNQMGYPQQQMYQNYNPYMQYNQYSMYR